LVRGDSRLQHRRSTVMLKDGGEIERLGAGAYRGSRCRLRHSISAVGPKIPYTKKRSLGPVLSPADLWSGYCSETLHSGECFRVVRQRTLRRPIQGLNQPATEQYEVLFLRIGVDLIATLGASLRMSLWL
jgi:hypothetical protein